jgi:hypothetical protein
MSQCSSDERRSKSLCFLPPVSTLDIVEERLLDIESPDENDECDDGPHPEDLGTSNESTLVDAMRRIRELERELEKSDTAVSAAVRDAFNAREEVARLKLKIAILESSRMVTTGPGTGTGSGTHRCDRGKGVRQDGEAGCQAEEVMTLKKRLEEAQLESGKAWRLLEEVRAVVSRTV